MRAPCGIMVASVGVQLEMTSAAGFAPVSLSFHLSTSSPMQRIDVKPDTPRTLAVFTSIA